MLLSDLVSYKNDRISVDATLDEAIRQMDHENGSHVILVEHHKAVGILTLKNIIALYRTGVDGNRRVIEFAMYPIISLHEDRPLDMAVEMMIDYEIRRVVLLDENEHYLGTLTQRDILKYYELQVQTTHEIFQCLNKRNRAILIEHTETVYNAITLLQEKNRDVLIVCEQQKPIGIVTEKDFLELANRKIPNTDLIALYMHTPITSINMDEKIHNAIDLMYEKNIHHLMVTGGNDELYVLTEKDLVLNYTTALEVRLEGKIRDAKATYNLLGIAYCEIIDLGESQIIKWLNAEAMMTFQVKIDDPVSKMFPLELWNSMMMTLRTSGGVEREKITVHENVYEATLFEAEVNNQSILKLFLNDVTTLVHLGEELRKSYERTIELEQEKSRLYLEVAAIMCLALDVEGNIVLINPKGCEILGITKEEAIGKNWFDTFVSPHQAAESKQLFLNVIAGKYPMVEYYENKVRTKNKEIRTIAWRNALIRDNEGIVIGSFSSGEDITRLQESERELERITHYDLLTNLPNRLLLNARLNHSIERSERERTKLAVLYIDIDNFKDINESFGYVTGDAVIMEVASKMERIIRHEDTIGRIGGDEFIVVLESIQDLHECDRILKEIVHVFEETIHTEENDFQLTASVGIALYPDDGEDAQLLVKNADIALRRAKEAGRSNYCYFAQEMSVQLFERVLMERELRRAVEEKEFVVYYQPQIDLQSGAVVGAEALVRWQHPSLGIVRPDMFIPLAESNHLIIPIGEQVLAQACITTKHLIEEGLFHGRISVNVSGKQFERPDAVKTLHRIISESTLSPEFVELEITESVLMSDPKALGEKLIALKNLGIEVAIDDFGTGYSSLSYLKTFPIDKLKIDQSFVRGIPSDEQDSAIVKAIIAMADALGLKTIAEGIEENAQGDYLKAYGCQQGQGYLYARPLSEEKFVEFLKYNKISKPEG
ncbi:MAG: EAL domain-containing protein [Sulfuricurvum sp.]|nr:EAL domain-containing protein [Sulfuricurvum sp.]